MRHTNMDSGFIICWLINMILNWEIGAVAFALWCVHLWFNLSWYPAAVVAGLWVFGTFAVTLFFGWVISSRKPYRPNSELKNVNPYSPGNSNAELKNVNPYSPENLQTEKAESSTDK